MSAASDPLDNVLSLAAKLYYLDGLSQDEVGHIIGVSRSTVSRLLARARDTGVVTISINSYRPRAADLEAELVRRFALRHAIVVRTLPEADVPNVRNTIGYVAAPYIAELVRPGMVIGAAGGRTLHDLVRYVRPVAPIPGVTVLQLMSNIGSQVGQIDAIEIGRTLAHKLGGLFFAVSAPVFAPNRATRDLFLSNEQVANVWSMFDRLGLALVGVGTLQNSAFVERRVLTAPAVAELAEMGVVGEICGRFYGADGRECDTPYRERVISLELDRLAAAPEVIGVTNGADRAAALAAALAGGLLTGLVIDEAGAQALLKYHERKEG